MGPLGFFDADGSVVSEGDPLGAIDRLVPWDSFRAEIEAVVLTPDELKKSSGGRKPFDAILMFRMLVLQALNNVGRAGGMSGARPAVILALSGAGDRGQHSR